MKNKKCQLIDILIVVFFAVFSKAKRAVTYSRLVVVFRQHRLTDALSILEDMGFCGEDALFILAWIGGGK